MPAAYSSLAVESPLPVRRSGVAASPRAGGSAPAYDTTVSGRWILLIGIMLGTVASTLALAGAALVTARQAARPAPGGAGEASCLSDAKGFEDILMHDGTAYQIVGAHGASLSWSLASADAERRCYAGHQGYLASVQTEGENEWLAATLGDRLREDDGDRAWIGGAATANSPDFEWWGGGTRLPFTYDHFATGGATDGDSLQPRCVTLGSDGHWKTRSCYATAPYWVVKFG